MDTADRTDLEVIDKLMSWDSIYHEQIQSICNALESCMVVGDLCTGLGYTAKALIERGKIVHGIDISQEALDYAKAKVGQVQDARFFPVLSDIDDLQYDSFFDGVSCLSNLGICSNVEGLVRIVKQALKPHGLFAITGQEPEQTKAYEQYLARELGMREPITFTEQQAQRFMQLKERWSSEATKELATTRNSSKYVLDPLKKEGMEIISHKPICNNMFYLIVARR